MDHENLVGVSLDLTLTDGSSVSGTVFTYVADKKLLVLQVAKSGDSSSFKMIRTPYISSMKMENDRSKIPAEKQLPRAFNGQDPLPPANKNIDTVTKVLKYLTNEQQPKREKMLKSIHSGGDDAAVPPVGAVEIFCELHRVYSTPVWNAEEQCIQISGLVISGRPDWSKPVVTVVNGSAEGENSKDRITQFVQKIVSGW